MQTNNIIVPWDSVNTIHDWGCQYYETIDGTYTPTNEEISFEEHIDGIIIFLAIYVFIMIVASLLKK
jgi:hypothetical protein